MICSSFVVFALAFAIPGLPGLAVEPGLPSKTAVMTAAARAIGTYDPDPSVRNPDWLAEHFLGPTERRLLDGTPWLNGLAQDYRELSRIPEVEPVVRYLLVRTKFIDERLIRAVEGGATQVIVLGAGFDSRAYRLREVLKGVRFIEVDFGPTQEYKKRRVRDVLGCLPENVTYAPIDFTREKLEDVLQRTGFVPTSGVCLGRSDDVPAGGGRARYLAVCLDKISARQFDCCRFHEEICDRRDRERRDRCCAGDDASGTRLGQTCRGVRRAVAIRNSG